MAVWQIYAQIGLNIIIYVTHKFTYNIGFKIPFTPAILINLNLYSKNREISIRSIKYKVK